MSQESPYTFEYRRRYNRGRRQKLSKLDVVRESLKAIGKEYCAESSICGLKHFVNDNTSYVERVIWIFTMIGALACSVSLVWITFRKYYMAPLVTTQVPEGISVSQIIFPAVGLCSTNRISKRAATELARELLQKPHNKKYNESELFTILFGLGQIYDLQMSMDDEKFNPVQIHNILGDYDVKDLFRRLTPSCESLLLRCSWNEVMTNCSTLFDFRLTMNGYCCTFNYLRRSEDFDEDTSFRNIDMYNYGNKSAFDFDQGLKVLMKFDNNDDFYYNIPLRGALLQFTDAYDFPDAPSGSFSSQIISPSGQMTVTVSASLVEASRDIQHVSVGLRGCLFYDESPYLPFYTYSDCMLKCRLLFLVENCNCTPFNMPSMQNYRTCNLKDVLCLRIYYAQSIAVRPDVDPPSPELELELVGGGISCPMCYPTCSKTTYSYDSTNVDVFPDILNDPVYDLDDWLVGANFTGTSILHVKYASEFAHSYEQNVIMKWFDLFSNIGSTCGFVTGFSFVSVLEFVYFFTIKLNRKIRLREQEIRSIDPQGHQKPLATVKSLDLSVLHEPVTRYRPIYWSELQGPTQFSHEAQINYVD